MAKEMAKVRCASSRRFDTFAVITVNLMRAVVANNASHVQCTVMTTNVIVYIAWVILPIFIRWNQFRRQCRVY